MATENSDSLLRTAAAVVAALLLLPILMMLLAMPMMGMMAGRGGTPGQGVAPMWGLGMGVVWFVVLVGVGYLLYKVITRGMKRARDPAIRELRTAYARGELTDEEFDRRRERLERDEE